MMPQSDHPPLPGMIGPPLPQKPARHRIDPLALAIGFAAAPFLTAAGFFWLVVPVPAVAFGLPFWIALGLPVLLWQMPARGPRPYRMALLAGTTALLASLAALPFAVIGDHINKNAELVGLTLFYGAFGTVMAMAWGAMFGWLYIRLLPKPRRDALRLIHLCEDLARAAREPAQQVPLQYQHLLHS